MLSLSKSKEHGAETRESRAGSTGEKELLCVMLARSKRRLGAGIRHHKPVVRLQGTGVKPPRRLKAAVEGKEF